MAEEHRSCGAKTKTLAVEYGLRSIVLDLKKRFDSLENDRQLDQRRIDETPAWWEESDRRLLRQLQALLDDRDLEIEFECPWDGEVYVTYWRRSRTGHWECPLCGTYHEEDHSE